MATSDGLRPLVPRVGSRHVLFATVAVVAFAVRLAPVLHGGGLRFYGRYDDGVYYAAADALVCGRVPYRDFVLLHPPGIMVVLSPFALLGRLTSDSTGMAIARLVFMAIGAVNAVLVTVLAHRWSRWAAVVAGLVYACGLPAAYAEETTMLEAVGGALVLIALLLLVRRSNPPTVRIEILAGAMLGLSAGVKIWYVAPWAVVVAWQLLVRRGWSALRILVGGAVALGLLVLPFAALSGTRMFDMVIRDQLLRPDTPSARTSRLASIFGIDPFLFGRHAGVATAVAVGLVIVAIAVLLALRDRTARVIVALFAANLAVLLASPSYFQHYAALTAAPLALVVGLAAGHAVAASRGARLSGAVVVVLLAAVLAAGVEVARTPVGLSFPSAAFSAAAPAGCMASDDPGALIQMNRLSRELLAGCHVDIDVTGITYDTLHRLEPGGRPVPRRFNAAWQRYLTAYLLSGTSFVVARRHRDGLAPATLAALRQQPTLASVQGLTLRQGDGSG